MNLNKLLRNKLLIGIIVLLFLLGFIIRVWYLQQGALSFAYDQARDAFIVNEILKGDLKILGPSVSGVPGLHHGVLYYYVLAVGYFLGNGSPLGVAYLMSFLNSLTVIIVFLLSFVLTKKILPALISALIFVVSFEASQYANLLTNASMAVWFVPIMYLGLYLWLKKQSKWAPILTGFGLGFSLQSEIALGYHLIPVVFWLYYFKKQIIKKEIIQFFSAFIIAVSTMIVVELKFGFKGISGLLYLFTSQDAIVQEKELGEFLIMYLNQVGKTFAHTLFPINIVLGGLLGLISILYSLAKFVKYKSKDVLSWQTFLVSYILAHIFALPFGGSNMRHITVGAVAGVSSFMGIFLWNYFRRTKIVIIGILLLIVISNLIKIKKENPQGQTIFPLQKDLILSKELQAIDYTYQKVGGEKFSINTLTSPLFINTLWSYLYDWYGKEKYSYVPFWLGKDQVGQLGNNLINPDNFTKNHFYIIEPTYGIPKEYLDYGVGEENSRSELIEEKLFGDIVVQYRKRK